MSSFTTPYDIANIGMQMLGVPRIVTFADSARQAIEAGFSYDKLRRAELRRFVWNFAVRRAVIRPITATSLALVFPAYAASTTYAAGDLVTYGGGIYSSLAGSNTGNTPDVGGTFWEVYSGALYCDTYGAAVTYYPGDVVVRTAVVYRRTGLVTSLAVQPPGTGWYAPASVTTATPFFTDPIGFNPPDGATTRNLYPMPNAYLRMAPNDPKQPAISRLDTSAGLGFSDWELENGFLISSAASGALILRFVADHTIPAQFNDLFCMSLGARMALHLNEVLTQRQDLAAKAEGEYARFVAEARAIEAIEAGSTEEDIQVLQPQQAQQPQRGR